MSIKRATIDTNTRRQTVVWRVYGKALFLPHDYSANDLYTGTVLSFGRGPRIAAACRFTLLKAMSFESSSIAPEPAIREAACPFDRVDAMEQDMPDRLEDHMFNYCSFGKRSSRVLSSVRSLGVTQTAA